MADKREKPILRMTGLDGNAMCIIARAILLTENLFGITIRF